jgi:hypothetical protein
MAARPTDWTPLAASDPIPGDPDLIQQEARYLKWMGEQISHEVAALRKIASGGADGALKGQYADQLHGAASDLAGTMEKAVGRFTATASLLGESGGGWAGELAQLQAKSLPLLDSAKSAHTKLTALQSQHQPSQPGDKAAHDRALKSAQGSVNDAQSQLRRLEHERDERASYYASRIKGAADDGVKDGFWDHFHDFVGHFANALKDVCTVLEIAGIILAVAAFIIAQFIPGLDVLVDALVAAAFWATLAATVGRGVLAASGNGSWADFAIDAFATITFGVGKFAAAGKFGGIGLKTLADGAESAGKVARSTELMANEKTAAYIARYADLTGESAVDIADRFGAKMAETAVKPLAGGLKVLASAGCSPEEAEAAAKAIAYGDRFGGLAAENAHLAMNAVKLAGGAAITGAGVGIGGIAGAGINFHYLPWHLNIPYVSSWYKGHVEIPTGDPEYV